MASATPVRRGRLLREAGFASDPAALRALAREATEPLDRESLGAMLLTDRSAAQLGTVEKFRPVAIGILGVSTITPLAPMTQTALVARGLRGEFAETGFDQWQQEILAGAPVIGGHRPRITVLVLDSRVVESRIRDGLDVDEIRAACESVVTDVSDWVARARDLELGRLVLTTVPRSTAGILRIADQLRRARVDSAWNRMNAGLTDLATGDDVAVLDLAALAQVTDDSEAPPRTRHTSSRVLGSGLLSVLADEIAALAAADMGRRSKVLALDLDDTLWGGIVGDDGPAGLAIGGAYPGNAHVELQSVARDLRRQGVLVVVCSKNDDATAMNAFGGHPEMVLRADDLVGRRVNWDPKPVNLVDLVEELNVGIDSVVFVDDNPVERSLMRSMQPEVHTIEVPADPAEAAETVLRARDFATFALSSEDTRRTEMYQAGRQRDRTRAASSSVEDFLRELGTEISIERLDEFNRSRIVQLFSKTNQFNLTGLRYSPAELDEAVRSGDDVLSVRVTDRFGDNGLAGALVVRRDGTEATVENMVLSCRVFSRCVEQAVVTSLLDRLGRESIHEVVGHIRPGAKNGSFLGFYADLGFAALEPDGYTRRFRHSLEEIPAIPDWISVTDPGGHTDE